MASVRPLRELLADLVGDADVRGPEAYLAEHGYPDLPAELVAQAVVSFADTAPPEVAEQLAPFVTAYTAGSEHTADWFDLLTSAPVALADDPDALDGSPAAEPEDDVESDQGEGLDFGTGAVDALDLTAPLDEVTEPATFPDTPETPEPTTSDQVTEAYLEDLDIEDEPDDEPDEESLN
ncbi:hypothetical protein [Actinophytocola sp.]|uniref:hypothetical protein n=1 Tax=Actinophytocola sp. TaxID=1872138 RepID=UPI002ECFC46D